MKTSLVLYFLLFASMFLPAQTAQTDARVTRAYNPDGWNIPGLKNAQIKPGTIAHAPADSKDFTLETTILMPGENDLARIPFVWLDAANHRIGFQEREVKVSEIKAYEVNSRPYCYQVSLAIHSKDPKTRAAGWAGLTHVWYYDETGDGVWRTMDTTGPLLPAVPVPPKWALGALSSPADSRPLKRR